MLKAALFCFLAFGNDDIVKLWLCRPDEGKHLALQQFKDVRLLVAGRLQLILSEPPDETNQNSEVSAH